MTTIPTAFELNNIETVGNRNDSYHNETPICMFLDNNEGLGIRDFLSEN